MTGWYGGDPGRKRGLEEDVKFKWDVVSPRARDSAGCLEKADRWWEETEAGVGYTDGFLEGF